MLLKLDSNLPQECKSCPRSLLRGVEGRDGNVSLPEPLGRPSVPAEECKSIEIAAVISMSNGPILSAPLTSVMGHDGPVPTSSTALFRLLLVVECESLQKPLR